MSDRYRTGSGFVIEVGEEIAAGAAGTAMAVRGRDDVVLKLLTSPTELDERRIKAMLTIDVPTSVPGAAAAIAWPTDLAFDRQGGYVGFLMMRVSATDSVTLATLASRHDRERRLTANIGWEALLTVTANYSAAVATLHACKVVVCDINMKNAMVSGDLTVTVIDCDSTQVEVGGTLYPSVYFQPEFLAPELHGGVGMREGRREESADRWALAVLIWMTLMDSHHPFAGVWSGPGELDRDDHIVAGRFPCDPASTQLEPSPHAPPWRALPPRLQRLFLTAFSTGAKQPQARPAALEWVEALRAAGTDLKRCDGASGRYHSFPKNESTCPWCEYEAYLNPSPVVAGPGLRTGATGSIRPKTKAKRRPASPKPQPGIGTTNRPEARQPVPAAATRSDSRTFALLVLALFLIAVVVAIAQDGGGSSSEADGGFVPSGAGSDGSAGGGGDSARRTTIARRRARKAPARAIRSHYTALGNGAYRRAFGFMAPSYRRENPRWLEQAREAQPRINIIHVGEPRIRGGVAWVPMRFFARDTYDTVRSDTTCRRFAGPAHLVKSYEGWRYDPTDDYAAVERPGGGGGCP